MLTPNEIDQFFQANGSLFPGLSRINIANLLSTSPRLTTVALANMHFKNPVIALILSIFVGTLGIDRFYVGQIGLGIGKLITGGGCGLWTIIDWALIMKAAKNKNYELLLQRA